MRVNDLAFLALFLSLASLQAKPQKEPPITPSFAKPVKSVVFTGGEVEIGLRANSPVRGTKYLIRSAPSMGQLGEIATTEDGLASITYRHHSGLGVGTDTFTYAVQSPGAAVSSRATVTIVVINRPPCVEAAALVDFGSVPVGSSTRRVVSLRNSGGEKYCGRLQLSSPWESVMGWVEIPAGEVLGLPVDFLPDAARGFSGGLYLDGPGGLTTKLAGAGFFVLDVSPSFLKLEEAPDGRRAARLTVSNKTDRPVDVEFECQPAIRPIAPLTIPAGEQVQVSVEADAEQKSGGRATLVVREKRVSMNVDLLIPPAPAQLLLDPASGVDFGAIAPGKSLSWEVTMTNSGGTPATVEISAPPWILVDPSRSLVKPGEQKTIRLEAAGARPGTFRDRIVFKSGKNLSELVVSAKVETVSQASASPCTTPTSGKPTLNLAETRRQALRITEISQDQGAVIVSWHDPNPDPRTYRLELLRITSEASIARQAAVAPDPGTEKFSAEEFAAERLKFTKIFEQASKNDKVVKTWVPLGKVDLHESGNRIFTAVFPAPPGQQAVRIRISPILSDGLISPVKTEIRIPLKQPPVRHWPVKTILLALVVLASLTVLVRKKMDGGRPRPQL